MLITIVAFIVCTIFIVLIVHFFNQKKYTLKEMGIHLVVTSIAIFSILAIDNVSSTYDNMYIHGVVKSKNVEMAYCSNYGHWTSYSDSFCTNEYTRQVKKCSFVSKKRKCHYYTQYKSVYPWEKKYYVNSSVGVFKIDREDSQGAISPKRYNIVEIGDPVTSTESYHNYIKASDASILKTNIKTDNIYTPNEIYDYYKLDNFMTKDKIKISNLNEDLRVLNSSLTKKANLVIVLSEDQKYLSDIQKNIKQNSKLNDIILFGYIKDNIIVDMSVKSWSKSNLSDVKLKDYFTIEHANMKITDLPKALPDIKNIIDEYYVLPSEKDYEYLKYDIKVSNLALVLCFIICFIFTPIISIYLSKD